MASCALKWQSAKHVKMAVNMVFMAAAWSMKKYNLSKLKAYSVELDTY
jgi:hypothetical protein